MLNLRIFRWLLIHKRKHHNFSKESYNVAIKAEGPVLQEVSTRSQVYEVLFYQFGYILVAFVSGSQLGF